MSKTSQITAFSLNKETDNLLKRLQNKFQKTRSELLREMIDFYVTSGKKTAIQKAKETTEPIYESEPNKTLRLFFQLISGKKPKPTIVISVGILNKKNEVLIGLRKNQDKFIKDLHWTFPSGKVDHLDFEKQVLKEIKEETGLDAKVNGIIHARLIPDSPNKPVRIIALYYHCKVLGGKQKPGGDFKELKWVSSHEVNRHFTTSVSDELMTFLGNLK